MLGGGISASLLRHRGAHAMGTLRRWIYQLMGRSIPATHRAARPQTRPPVPKPATEAGELSLLDETTNRPKTRHGSAGVNPYSNDAGYSKPHSWERIDHD
jgi:hypothetical protein